MRIVLAIFMFLAFCPSARAQTYIVKRVINGDTFELTTGVTVHMIGVKAAGDEPADGGLESEMYESSVSGQWIDNIVEQYLLTPGVQVFLQYDVSKRDNAGNILAYVYRKRPIDDTDFERKGCWSSTFINEEEYLFINEYLICSGAADAVSEPPNVKYAERFRELHENAMKYKSGY